MVFMIRPVEPEDVARVVEVSLAADTLFAGAGIELPPDDPREVLELADRVLVAVRDGRVCALAATFTLEGAVVPGAAAPAPAAHPGSVAVPGPVWASRAAAAGGATTHLEQLAVHPDHSRRGVGGALVEAVRAEAADRGHALVTLTTFRDLPWNGPWYGRRGFAVLPRVSWGPGLERRWEAEERAGIMVRPRIVMAGRCGPGCS